LNLIKPGANYGWPVITYGMNYDGSPMVSITEREGMEQPVTFWVPSIAVCGLDFYAGDKFPKWKNDLLVAAGPDGFIYVLLNGPDRVVRLVPNR
jgi:glucose/arabinose dehydrogenase